ncbi:TPA: hypothetical protein U1Z56_000179 [Streptococcus suis]|uniref:hypothetical protein n=1 Tax=Streptococcus suis TaxID=1307 RepID=UPI0015822ACC|nr:hypothetical protein [Streptococcus suis]MCK3889233.1 hypothetical protein [Streptococcus suis]HEM4595993.1 hypothetical protein [Streptococcus suis]
MKYTAKEIKQDLKEMLNIKANQISVKVTKAGYADTYIDVKIKDINISLNDVEEYLAHFESITRDRANDEILQGCNTFVMVAYDYETYKQVVDSKMDEVAEIMNNYNDDSFYSVIIKEEDDCKMYACKAANRISIYEGKEQKGKFAFNEYALAEALIAFDRLIK